MTTPEMAPPLTVSSPADTATRRPRRADYTIAPGLIYHYDRPRSLRFLPNAARDLGVYPKQTFRHPSWPAIGAVVAGTAILIPLDQPILDAAQQFGRWIRLEPTSRQTTLVGRTLRYGNGQSLALEFNVPTTVNGAMYFIGDGWTHLSLAAGFWTYGLLGRDNRASQVSSEIVEAVIASGIVVQVLKRTTGRQSPFVADVPGGRWRPFPNQLTYTRHVPQYDAFPSGHLTTALATLTVIADNYPEYRYVRPVGYSLLGLLSYAMLNNGVHWISDYPLAIALGYGFGKLAVARGRTRVSTTGGTGPRYQWRACLTSTGPGLVVRW